MAAARAAAAADRHHHRRAYARLRALAVSPAAHADPRRCMGQRSDDAPVAGAARAAAALVGAAATRPDARRCLDPSDGASWTRRGFARCSTMSAERCRSRAGPTDVRPGRRPPNPLDPTRRIRAVLFDLDGTLYRQRPLRSLMALELLTLPMSGLLDAPKRWRALRAYRKTQEQFERRTRGCPRPRRSSRRPRRRSGLAGGGSRAARRRVDDRRPLKYLRLCRAKGLERLLSFLETRRAGPGSCRTIRAESKLRRSGCPAVSRRCSAPSAPEVMALKPSPRGFLLRAEPGGSRPATCCSSAIVRMSTPPARPRPACRASSSARLRPVRRTAGYSFPFT